MALEHTLLASTSEELDPVEIKVSVPERYIVQLQQSLDTAVRKRNWPAASVKIDAVSGQMFAGQVRAIVPRANLRTRSFPVRVVVPNPGHVLKPGMLARVSLAVGVKKRALLVHKDALVLGGRSTTVFVARLDPKTKQTQAIQVDVQTGVAVGSLIEIRGKITANDRVVVEGNERLRPGQLVQIKSERPATSQKANP
ncbi:MAG: efflux RND transporter periplasmic adaptor subunit [Planctomycetes bacterium]|nr:efflux RND transporter periplasmic adaptor subunit [Planctomycetota bacterium]